MTGLNPDDSRPPYQQVADALRQAIASGKFKPGAKLPSHHAIVGEYRVSLGTVKRAYGVLQADGLIVTRQGQGSFVRNQPTEQRQSGGGAGRDDVWDAIDGLTKRVAALERRVGKR